MTSTPIGNTTNTILSKIIDIAEAYGANVIRQYLTQLGEIAAAADIGAGSGRDLGIVRERFTDAELHGVECMPQNMEMLRKRGVLVHSCNIETESLPFADNSLDLILCNQIIEHTKELFWIFHELTRSLKVGGHLIIGVPNVASLHNRVCLLFGKHPTQAKACSAHIRCFSRNDFLLFLNESFPRATGLSASAEASSTRFPARLPARWPAPSRPWPFPSSFCCGKFGSMTGLFWNTPSGLGLKLTTKSAEAVSLRSFKFRFP